MPQSALSPGTSGQEGVSPTVSYIHEAKADGEKVTVSAAPRHCGWKPNLQRQEAELGPTPETERQIKYDPKAPELHQVFRPAGVEQQTGTQCKGFPGKNHTARRPPNWHGHKREQCLMHQGGYTQARPGAMCSHGDKKREGNKNGG